MFRDKLSRRQRIRLEALSIVAALPSVSNDAKRVIDKASIIENYIRYGKEIDDGVHT